MSSTFLDSAKRLKWALLALPLLAFPGSSVQAQPSPQEVCREVARKADRTLWDGMREAGDDLFCRKPWVSRRPDELAACGVTSLGNKFGNRVKNKWNRFFEQAGGEWATWGARGVSEEWEEGTIRGGFRRVFFGPGLAFHRSTVEAVKEGGRAEAFVTVCELDYDGNVVSTRRASFPNGPGNENEPRTIGLANTDNRILGVVVDTPASVNRFEYRVRLTNEAIRNNLGAVRGVADLHVHQIVDLAFGGRMYWGSHTGDKPTALAEEVITGPLSPLVQNLTPGETLARITSPGLDANILLWVSKQGRDDEGFFQLGGRGFPGYRQWPHHADRSHQQAHISWLQEAHERGRENGTNLNLMVASLVNNDVLCSALKLVDPYGNVPVRDSRGEIAGWESASWGCSDHENVLRQLKAIHKLEQENPWYRVAMSPWHARQIIADGDLAVIVSLETDKPLSGDGGNYGKWLDQLDLYRAMGLTTLQIVHESNSRFCGAAPHRNMMQALQAVHWPLKSLANFVRSGSTFNLDGNRYNGLGLTKEGEELVDALVARSMPIDLAHGSQRCRKAILSRVPESYGLYDSHTKFKRLLEPAPGGRSFGTCVLDREQEFLIMESLLPDYVRHRVLVGLRTSSVDFYDAPNAAVPNDCPGTASSFAQLVQYANDSGLEFAYGTDFNTGVSQLGPRFGPGRCWASLVHDTQKCGPRRPVSREGALPARARQVAAIDGTNYYTDGLANIGWLPELTQDLIALGTPGAQQLTRSAEAYVAMWERAHDAQPAAPPVQLDEVAPGSLALGLACTNDDQCGSGRCSSIVGARGVCVCNEDDDCGAGNFCNMGVDLQVNACQPLKADGESCAAIDGGRTCRGGRCAWGRCYTRGAVAMGGTCYVDDACAQGKCSSIDGTRGRCVCKEDSDCGAGFWCDKGLDLNVNSCKRKLSRGEICGKVGDINVGHRCRSGSCKVSGISTNLRCQ
ncbi:MAG TPA: membrane dipeptidase [Thermoanaerobaculia bacterium]|nr:membrane dipeptidase [Thermoanaerobaculia bacterium]